MELFTHALGAAAVARAAFPTTRFATPIAVAGGLVADMDSLALLGGADSYFHYNRSVTHSVPGVIVMAGAVAAAVWFLSRKVGKPVALGKAILICLVAGASHLLLDLCNPYGVQLLWPFSAKWTAWDLLDTVDPWILFLLIAGLLLPALFRLVSEEIGAKPAGRGAQRWAIATLVVVFVYAGARYYFHSQAVEMLNGRMYHGLVAVKVGAFPWHTSPLRWHGVISTETTLEQIEVPIGPAGVFDPDRSRTRFKPDASPALAAALGTGTVKQFIAFARFPIATVERLEQGHRVTVRDLRFPEGRPLARSVVAEVELDNSARVTHESFRFSAED